MSVLQCSQILLLFNTRHILSCMILLRLTLIDLHTKRKYIQDKVRMNLFLAGSKHHGAGELKKLQKMELRFR